MFFPYYLELFSKSYPKEFACRHTGIGVISGFCVQCGKKVDDESCIAFGYLRKNLRLANEEMARLCNGNFEMLPPQEKNCLVLDLDQTLLNSCLLSQLTAEEVYLMGPQSDLPDAFKSSLYRVDSIHRMTKLRPFVHSFLKEASKLFEMYICTMGGRGYAAAVVKLLDPGDEYFKSRVITKENCTKNQKGLDVVLGREGRAALILDDREDVWRREDMENLILVERYHFFASSCRQFGLSCKSLSQQRTDESEADGALAAILRVLQQIHSSFFHPETGERLANLDIRQVLKTVRGEVLKGCKIVITDVYPSTGLEKMAEKLGATCTRELEPSVTHVVSSHTGTVEAGWAAIEKKFLVNLKWIEAAFYLWQKQPEENYSVDDSWLI